MLSHDRVWAAIDALASRYGMTASGLARKAGLDATSFNKSKRTSPEGRDRWPSTESISKILQATGATLDDFLQLIDPAASLNHAAVPLLSTAKANAPGMFDSEGQPSGGPEWGALTFPDLGPEKVFALEVDAGDMAPFFREGDVLIVSPTATLKKGDRVVVKTTKGELLARELRRRSTKTLELGLPSQDEDLVIPNEDVAWVARVMWARM
jgi:phage repressor protein C with HTH and peptisase S24 domain